MRNLAIIPLIALASCGPKEVPVLILPPAQLAACAEMPDAPDLADVDWSSIETAHPIQRARDTATLGYILALRTAYGDCRSKVDGLAAWRDTVE